MTTHIQNTRLARNLLPVIALTVLASASSIVSATADDRRTSSANDDPALYQSATESVGRAAVETMAGEVTGSIDSQRIWVRDVDAGDLSPHVAPDADWLKSTAEELETTDGTLAKKTSRFFFGLSLVQAAKDLDPTAVAEAFLSGSAAGVAAGARILLTPVQGPTDAQIWMDNNPPNYNPGLEAQRARLQSMTRGSNANTVAAARRSAPKRPKSDSIDSAQALELLNSANNMAFDSLRTSASAVSSARNSVDNSALREREMDITLGIVRDAVSAAAEASRPVQRYNPETAPATSSIASQPDQGRREVPVTYSSSTTSGAQSIVGSREYVRPQNPCAGRGPYCGVP